jgi:hypothetical protein
MLGILDSYATLYKERIIEPEQHTQEGAWQQQDNVKASRSRDCVGSFTLIRMLNNSFDRFYNILF